MMRKLFSIVVLLLFSGIFYSQNTEDLIGVPELTFNESKYILASAQQKSKVQFVQEYILEDERIEDASAVITIYFFNKNIDAKEATYQKTEELDRRAETDKYCTYNVTENPNGTEFVVDFITTNVPKDKKTEAPEQEFADYNIYRFRNTLLGEESTFMIIAYEEKSTGDAKGFQKSIGKKRNKLLEGIITMTIPSVTLKTN